MIDVTSLKTYRCGEYETVNLPIGDLVGANGELHVFPEANTGRFFDIDYAKGKLSLRSKGIVGLIPISEKVAIHVSPRAPIANLLYMTWRAGSRPESLAGFIRGYQTAPTTLEDPEDLYLRAFLDMLQQVERAGLLRRYRRRETTTELRGRLLVNPTVTRFRAKGVRHRNVFEVHEHTVDNPENRILKFVIQRLANHVRGRVDPQSRQDFARLRKSLELFEMVDASKASPEGIARQTPALVRGLPRSHQSYEPVLWLCHLIATRSGVLMETTGQNRFETLLIDVGVVFENYVRRICEDFADEHLGGCRVLNGNKRPVYLFIDNRRHEAHPDCYFKRGGTCLALADAKYKRRIDANDRYEVLGFCEALQVDMAAFICPMTEGLAATELHGTTARGRRLFVLPIDLSVCDMEAEERRFASELGTVLGLSSPAA